MIRVSKLIVVDGEELNVSAEGGSAKEALAMVDHEAEALGAAPRAAALAKNGATRTRRTKAELEAARAAQETPAPAAPGPEPARVFAAPVSVVGASYPANSPGQGYAPGPSPITLPEPGAVFTPSQSGASFAPGPAAPQAEKSVAFDGPPPPTFDAPSPPPPPPSEEDALRERISAAVNATIELKPAWREAVTAALNTHAGRHGGDVYRMNAAQLGDVLRGVEEYRGKVSDAVRGQPR